MDLIAVPENVKAGRPDCSIVQMGPPQGVSDEHVGTAEMLISKVSEEIPGYLAKRQYAYYKPTEVEVELLKNGGVIEFCQYGNIVQPFSAGVWPSEAAG